DTDELVYETRDLLYHCLVLLADQGVDLADVEAEWRKRSSKKGNAKKERQEIENRKGQASGRIYKSLTCFFYLRGNIFGVSVTVINEKTVKSGMREGCCVPAVEVVTLGAVA